jgi:transcriptional regulator NrdR family protein
MAKSMNTCPSCEKQGLKITDTRETKFNDIATVRRRKICLNCGFIFTTYEIPAVILNSDKLFQHWNIYIEQFKKLTAFLNKND